MKVTLGAFYGARCVYQCTVTTQADYDATVRMLRNSYPDALICRRV
jgi:hypothetical protein